MSWKGSAFVQEQSYWGTGTRCACAFSKKWISAEHIKLTAFTVPHFSFSLYYFIFTNSWLKIMDISPAIFSHMLILLGFESKLKSLNFISLKNVRLYEYEMGGASINFICNKNMWVWNGTRMLLWRFHCAAHALTLGSWDGKCDFLNLGSKATVLKVYISAKPNCHTGENGSCSLLHSDV